MTNTLCTKITYDEAERRIYRDLTRKRGEEVRIEHVKSHTGVRGNEAADRLAALGAQIQDGHRIVERNCRMNCREPQIMPQMLDAEYKDARRVRPELEVPGG